LSTQKPTRSLLIRERHVSQVTDFFQDFRFFQWTSTIPSLLSSRGDPIRIHPFSSHRIEAKGSKETHSQRASRLGHLALIIDHLVLNPQSPLLNLQSLVSSLQPRGEPHRFRNIAQRRSAASKVAELPGSPYRGFSSRDRSRAIREPLFPKPRRPIEAAWGRRGQLINVTYYRWNCAIRLLMRRA
jgi:hypothetical protein